MIEIIIRDTDDNSTDKITGNIAFFAVVKEDRVHGTIKGNGTQIDYSHLYTMLKEVRKIIERDHPAVRFLECCSNPEMMEINLLPFKDIKKGED